MTKEELKPIDVSKYTVTESGNVIKSEEKETTKEDFFRQNFSEYCRGDTFLSPYWDLFEAGYELKQDILSQHILELQADKGSLTDKVRELEQQIEKLIDFVLSKTECCDVCPITDTCINDEGTCPYVGILAKSEEEVTREWLMQFILRR